MTYYSFEKFSELKGLKLINMNVQSLTDKIGRIRRLNLHVDHLSITETWLDARDQDWHVDIVGMTLFRNDRLNAERKSGGVCCYVPDIYSGYTSIIDEFTITTPDIECLAVITKYPTHKYRIIIHKDIKKNNV